MLFSLEAYNIVYVCDIFLFIPALKARDNDNYRTCRSMFGVWHQNELYLAFENVIQAKLDIKVEKSLQ